MSSKSMANAFPQGKKISPKKKLTVEEAKQELLDRLEISALRLLEANQAIREALNSVNYHNAVIAIEQEAVRMAVSKIKEMK